MNRRLLKYKEGVRDGFPIFLGYLAVSFSFGIQAKKLGMNAFQAGFMSLSNVTSAGQFSGLTLIFAGTTLVELALTQFIINSRYMLMSSALSQRIHSDQPLHTRMLMAFGVTDEVFALSIAQEGILDPVYTYGLMSSAIPGWVSGTVLGVLSGSLLPTRVLDALGLALYGMLIAIIVPPAKESKILAFFILLSMASHYCFTKAPGLRELSGGVTIIILTMILTSVAALLFPREETDDEL